MKSWHYFNRLTNSSGFREAKVISPDLVLVYTTPPTVLMKKPTQVKIVKKCDVSLVKWLYSFRWEQRFWSGVNIL